MHVHQLLNGCKIINRHIQIYVFHFSSIVFPKKMEEGIEALPIQYIP